jgi:hypothetical protein
MIANMKISEIVPSASTNGETVYDFAVFVDRSTYVSKCYSNGFRCFEYEFETTMNSSQVMHEDNDKDHTFNLRMCAEFLLNEMHTYALVELGEDYGKVLRVFTEKELIKVVNADIYKRLVNLRDAYCKYEEAKAEVLEIDKDIEYLSSDDFVITFGAILPTISIKVIRPEIKNEIMNYLNKKYRKNVGVNVKSTYVDDPTQKIKELNDRKEILMTPGVKSIM